MNKHTYIKSTLEVASPIVAITSENRRLEVLGMLKEEKLNS